jgi:chaperonin GroEL
MELSDDIEQQGLELLRNVAEKTNEEAGDGTTTSIVLAHAIVEQGLKFSENTWEIVRSLEQAKIKSLEELKKLSKPLRTNKEILELATVTSHSQEWGKRISDIFNQVGRDAVVIVEQSSASETQIATVEGYEIEKGFHAAYMGLDEGRAIMESGKVLVIGERITSSIEIMNPLQEMLNKGLNKVAIFCVDIDVPVLLFLMESFKRGGLNSLVVKANSQKNEILEDIAIVTGAKYIGGEKGVPLNKADFTCFGSANKITATRDKTIIVNNKEKSAISQKIREIKSKLPSIHNGNEYDLAEKRMGRLGNKMAIISVGAKTGGEAQKLYLQIEDGVNAVKSALEEGIVEGGGLTLYKISQTLTYGTIGERILKEALKVPFKKLIENCGKDYADILLGMPKDQGYDSQNGCYVNMFKQGIIDPTKVERCAIENAVSFANVFLTSKSAIALKRENKGDE